VRKWRNSIKRRKFRTRGKRRRVNIAKLTKISFLPSLFTIFSLFLGYLALLQIVKGSFIKAVYFMGGSVLLDGFDGTVARLTKTESNFGVQLDSLVDAVAFGLVTAAMIYFWGFKAAEPALGKVIGFVFLSAGVIRLARFNPIGGIVYCISRASCRKTAENSIGNAGFCHICCVNCLFNDLFRQIPDIETDQIKE
jgi:CDP-diacylglycerol--serine O-phosphatidyltransferase